MEKPRAIIAPVLLLLFTACGGGSSSPRSAESATPSSATSPTPTRLVQHDEPGPAPAGAIEEVMNHIKYEMPDITAPHGRIVIHLVNEEVPPRDCTVAGPGLTCLDHDMVITDSTGNVLAHSARVKPGHDSVFTLDDVPAGGYLFYCSNGGHASNGMKGSLIVS